MRTLTYFWIAGCSAVASAAPSAPSPQSGTLTALEGVVELLSSPSRTAPAEKSTGTPRALFEGLYYEYRQAKIGDRVGNGTFLRVRPGGKAQLVFDNGDMIHLGPGSLFRPQWKQDSGAAPKAAPSMEVPYGNLHALISKSGPRSKLKIRTNAMVLGVRGTEFAVQSGAGRADQLSVLRGEVQVSKPSTSPGASDTPISVKENQTARIEAKPQNMNSQLPPKVEVARTTKEEITAIQQLSEPPKADPAQPKPQEVLQLEQKATQVAIQDVREYHPEMAATLASNSSLTAAQIQSRMMEKAKEEAPSGGPVASDSSGSSSKPKISDVKEWNVLFGLNYLYDSTDPAAASKIGLPGPSVHVRRGFRLFFPWLLIEVGGTLDVYIAMAGSGSGSTSPYFDFAPMLAGSAFWVSQSNRLRLGLQMGAKFSPTVGSGTPSATGPSTTSTSPGPSAVNPTMLIAGQYEFESKDPNASRWFVEGAVAPPIPMSPFLVHALIGKRW